MERPIATDLNNTNGLSRPKTRTLREWVLNELTQRILDGSFPPGSRLIEANLASDLGVSRSPLREALRQLEQDGLVTTLPNTSTVVAPIRRSDIDEIYEIRIHLEPTLMTRVAERSNMVDFSTAHRLIEMMRDSKNGIVFATADFDLHRLLWSQAERPRIASFLQGLSLQALRQLSLAAPGLSADESQRSYDEHLAIITAIEAQDGEASAEAMRMHLVTGRNRILKVVEQQREEEDQIS